jgi:hypothetical protein
MGDDRNLDEDDSDGGREKHSDPTHVLNIEPTEFGQGYKRRTRELQTCEMTSVPL